MSSENATSPRIALQSHVGLVRERNEDAHGHATTPGGALLLVVADGMGGHPGGDVASAIATETILEIAASSHADPEVLLQEAILEADHRILARGTREVGLAGMGTTVVALLVDPSRGTWTAHVGDSRVYLQRGGQICALTRDHTLVAELERRGVISEEEARSDPRRHQLTRCVGTGRRIEVEVQHFETRPGDRFLLCSDGLSGVVESEKISELMQGDDPDAVARALVEAANACGGPDNVTVALAWLR